MVESRAYMGGDRIQSHLMRRIESSRLAKESQNPQTSATDLIRLSLDVPPGLRQRKITKKSLALPTLVASAGLLLAACSGGGESGGATIVPADSVEQIPTVSGIFDEKVLKPEIDVELIDSSDEAPHEVAIGKIAPDFVLSDVDGRIYDIRDFRGNPLILLIRSGGCGPCDMETESIINLKNRFSEYNLQFLTVQIEDTSLYPMSSGIDGPVLLDHDNSIMDKYIVLSNPSAYFIDEIGVVRYSSRGLGDFREYGIIVQDMIDNVFVERADIGALDSEIATVGRLAPDFVLNDKDGNPVRLSELSDKPMILQFTTPDCAWCTLGSIDIFAPQQGINEDDLNKLVVNIPDSLGNTSGYPDYVTAVFDYFNELRESYPFEEFPATYFIDENRIIREAYEGRLIGYDIWQASLRLIGSDLAQPVTN